MFDIKNDPDDSLNIFKNVLQECELSIEGDLNVGDRYNTNNYHFHINESRYSQIERSGKLLRGDDHGERLESKVVIQKLAEALGITEYTERYIDSLPANRPTGKEKLYRQDFELWNDIIRNRNMVEGAPIVLEGFNIVQWLPISPGKYYLPSAVNSREEAIRFYDTDRSEYLPIGKGKMVAGGIGCVRLRRGNDEKQFLCATSTGVCHGGIPIVLDKRLYNRVIPDLTEFGYVKATLMGTIRLLSKNPELMIYASGIPKFCFVVDSIMPMRNKKETNIIATAAAIFPETSGRNTLLNKLLKQTYFEKSWTFCSFNPEIGQKSIMDAAFWIKDYCLRYSQLKNPPILADFDEYCQYFDDVEFSISNIRNNQIKKEFIKPYIEHFRELKYR